MTPPLPSEKELSELNLYEMVKLLGEVYQPEPVSYFPATILWVWLALLFLFLLGMLASWRYQRWKKERYRGQALQALRDGYSSYEGAEYARFVSHTLKWAALRGYPRSQVAKLKGKAWLEFLSKTSVGVDFQSGPGSALAEEQYGLELNIDKETLSELATQWLREHRTAAGGRT